jgi:hypothetical protein
VKNPEEKNMGLDPTDPLIMRLSALDIPVPATLVPRVLSGRRTRRIPRRLGRRLVLTAVTLTALVAGNLGASYLSPRYAQALADSPAAGAIAGPLLQEAGLAGTGATSLDASATASGYTVRVFGGYADGVRTTLFVQILDSSGHATQQVMVPFDATLTDQFGHTYHHAPAGGAVVLNFEPLVWPVSTLGARLTLHIPNLLVVPSDPQTAARIPKVVSSNAGIQGSWDLHFTLMSTGGHDLAVPPAVQLGDTTYTFTTMRATASLLEVSWTISGGAVQRQNQYAIEVGGRFQAGTSSDDMDRMGEATYREMATSKLFDPKGRQVTPIYGSGHGIMQGHAEVSMIDEAWYPITGSGLYRFQVSDNADPADARIIDVP